MVPKRYRYQARTRASGKHLRLAWARSRSEGRTIQVELDRGTGPLQAKRGESQHRFDPVNAWIQAILGRRTARVDQVAVATFCPGGAGKDVAAHRVGGRPGLAVHAILHEYLSRVGRQLAREIDAEPRCRGLDGPGA